MSHPVPFRRKHYFWMILVGFAILAPVKAQADQDNPVGNCCVARVTMTGENAWNVTCGSCASNPGVYAITQPDPEKLTFVGPGGVTAPSRYEAAQAICQCPSQKARHSWEQRMRSFDGR